MTKIGTNYEPSGESAPELTEVERAQWHPDCVALYESLAASGELDYFRTFDWLSAKLVLHVVSAHLWDMAGYERYVEDESRKSGYRRVPVLSHAKVGVLNEIAAALDRIHATPAGRLAHALSVAALAKAVGAVDPEEEAQKAREVSAEEATAVLLARLEQHAAS